MNIKFRHVLLLAVSLFFVETASATDVVDVKPLTARILVIHFDDGYVAHHKRGQERTHEFVFADLLNLSSARSSSSYKVISSNDANFFGGKAPLEVGFKSKPTEFALRCDTYDNGCVNNSEDHVREHWAYLFLPDALKTGNAYRIEFVGLGPIAPVEFVFDEKQLHSDAIHVNNIGYSTEAPTKYAYLYHWMGDKGSLDLSSFNEKEFHLVNASTMSVAFTGSIGFRAPKTQAETGQTNETPGANFSASDVWECDFSSFNVPGVYRIVVPGIGCSFDFAIGQNVYDEPFFWVMKSIYQNRSGISLSPPYAQYQRPAPHNPKVTPGFSGRLKYSSFRTFDLSGSDGNDSDKPKIEALSKGVLNDTWGWYQDAGDWDGYYTHTHIPAYLLFLYEAAPGKFYDNELEIPESGNGIPDVLDEASWLLRYFKRAKDEIKSKGWGTGGIPGARVFGDLWGSDVASGDRGIGSWEDTGRDWYLLGEDPWTSYKYAALAAQLAHIYDANDLADPEDVDWAQEAIDAYSWADSHIRSGDENEKLSVKLQWVRFYAASSLYRLTGNSEYHVQAIKDSGFLSAPLSQETPDMLFGPWMYLLAGNQMREAKLLNNTKAAVKSAAAAVVSPAQSRACRWGGDFYFPMLVGQATTPKIPAALFGYLLEKDQPNGENILKYTYTTADYFLGTNPLNMTWISGIGERYPVGVFHLDWWYSDKDDPTNREPVVKGIVPYGPWRVQDFGPLGWWSPAWAYSDKAGTARIYPENINNWPGHERWFDQRISPMTSEFTVHQTNIIAAFIYGFLKHGESADLAEGVVTAIGNEKSSELTLYPNPASGSAILTIPSEQVITDVKLVDLAGRFLPLQFTQHQNQVTITALPKVDGVFVVILRSIHNNVYRERIVLTR
jgi:endoglucanase